MEKGYYTVGLIHGLKDDEVYLPNYVSGTKILLRHNPWDFTIIPVTVNNDITIVDELKKYGILMTFKLAIELGLDLALCNEETVEVLQMPDCISDNDTETHTLQILFSTRQFPKEIKKMIMNDDNITALLNIGKLSVRIYDSNPLDGLRFYLTDLTKEHGFITKLEKKKNGWFADVRLEGKSLLLFKCFENPVIHPTIVSTDESPWYKVVFFKIVERELLVKDKIYNGNHYPASLRNDCNDDEEEFIFPEERLRGVK